MAGKYLRIIPVLFILPLLQVPCAVAQTTIAFDDLDKIWSDGAAIPNSYAGFNWTNFYSMCPVAQFGTEVFNGYLAGTVSPDFVAYNEQGGPAELARKIPFDFLSAYLTAAWLDDLQITVEGFLGSKLLYTQTVKVSAVTPALFKFNYRGVDRVTFASSGTRPHWPDFGSGTHFVMDDLTVNTNAFPEDVPVTIDIKPGSTPNSINAGSKGVVPVAILSTQQFDASMLVDRGSLTFGYTGDERSLAACAAEDVNQDGMKDLICHFYTQKTGFGCGATVGTLKGKTTNGTSITGTDTVQIVPCKN